jgi:hypothetical protein
VITLIGAGTKSAFEWFMFLSDRVRSDCTATLREVVCYAPPRAYGAACGGLRGLGRFLRKLLTALALHDRPSFGGRPPAECYAPLGGAPTGLRPPPLGAASRAGKRLLALAQGLDSKPANWLDPRASLAAKGACPPPIRVGSAGSAPTEILPD